MSSLTGHLHCLRFANNDVNLTNTMFDHHSRLFLADLGSWILQEPLPLQVMGKVCLVWSQVYDWTECLPRGGGETEASAPEDELTFSRIQKLQERLYHGSHLASTGSS
jgi:hypothetical protein